MILDTAKLKISTKTLVAFLGVMGTLLQIPAVGAPIFAFAKLHPHFASALAAVTGIIALLHNPQVAEVLGIKQTVEVKTEEVSLPAKE